LTHHEAALIKAVLFDVDGTLVDSNDAHAEAWVRAFSEFDIEVDPTKVRRCIGMGGDKLMPAVAGILEESPVGARIASRRSEIFKQDYLPNVQPLPGADRLVAAVKERGLTAVAASSAKKDELRALLKIANADSLMDAATSSDDAEESKPDPDIIIAALQRAKASPQEAIMIGDTPYDVEAALRAGVRVIAFQSGGWGIDDLKGAVAVYQGPLDLVRRFNSSPLVSA
jgi:HAD superfamily hydrolase (TIGR01509 family)